MLIGMKENVLTSTTPVRNQPKDKKVIRSPKEKIVSRINNQAGSHSPAH